MTAAKAKTRGEEMLRMGELARASGVSAATIKHYLREGLLPEPVKTSRNMAYYPADFVDRIRMIKQLQEERYMPLRVIKDLLDENPDRATALVKQEVDVLMERLAGEMDPDEAMQLIEAGTQPLNDLLAAMHTKALVAELERRRGTASDYDRSDS